MHKEKTTEEDNIMSELETTRAELLQTQQQLETYRVVIRKLRKELVQSEIEKNNQLVLSLQKCALNVRKRELSPPKVK